MEILFKDDVKFFHITDNRLNVKYIISYPDIDLTNITHLNDAEVLYHYKYIRDGDVYPVYYEHGEYFISQLTGNINYLLLDSTKLAKDYTLVNLNLI